jgi:hypothetical protein
MQKRKSGAVMVVTALSVIIAAISLGCATAGIAAPYYFAGGDETAGASIYVDGETVVLAAVEGIELPSSGAASHWSPLCVPDGEPFMLTVNAAGQTVNFPVPPLDEGAEYQIVLQTARDGTAVLVLAALEDGRVIHEELAAP